MESIRRQARSFYRKSVLESPLLWQYGLNAGATLKHRKSHAVLNSEAKRVLDSLNQDGVALTTVDTLTGDPNVLITLQAEAARLEAAKGYNRSAVEHVLAETEAFGNGEDEKLFRITMLDPHRPQIYPDGVLARFVLNKEIKNIADSYFGLSTHVADINVWRNLPIKHGPVASQLWHRDLPDDRLLLKMFVYLEDVPEGAGPFSYVKGTHGKGDRTWSPPVRHDGYNWRSDDASMNSAAMEERQSCYPGPAGTVLFADTIGWHKGGEAKTASRFVLQVLYNSPAALPDRKLSLPADVDPKSALPGLRYDFNLRPNN